MHKSFAIPSILFLGGLALLWIAPQELMQKPTAAAQDASEPPRKAWSPGDRQAPSNRSTPDRNADRNPFEANRDGYTIHRNRFESRFHPFDTFAVNLQTNTGSPTHSLLILRDPNTKKLMTVSADDATPAEKEAWEAHEKEIGKAMDTIMSPKSSDADKEQARKLIAEELDFKFELDLDERRQQLKGIEKQLEDLRVQLTARQESKNKLIELRMQLIENESKGLGFPATWSRQSPLEWRH